MGNLGFTADNLLAFVANFQLMHIPVVIECVIAV